MENRSYQNSRPSYEGLDKKKHSRKNKQKKAPNSVDGLEVAALAPEVGLEDANDPGNVLGGKVISALQEFVQDGKSYRMPWRTSILEWTFEEEIQFSGRTNKSGNSQYSAAVSFVLDGVRHHSKGDWYHSKSLAKRDAAERALGLFVGDWGALAMQEEQASMYDLQDGSGMMHQKSQEINFSCNPNATPQDTLIDFCRHYAPCGQNLPEFYEEWEGNSCTGCVNIVLFETPHTFAGAACQDVEAAHADVARRVLWYLQSPGFTDAFEVDMEALLVASKEGASAA